MLQKRLLICRPWQAQPAVNAPQLGGCRAYGARDGSWRLFSPFDLSISSSETAATHGSPLPPSLPRPLQYSVYSVCVACVISCVSLSCVWKSTQMARACTCATYLHISTQVHTLGPSAPVSCHPFGSIGAGVCQFMVKWSSVDCPCVWVCFANASCGQQQSAISAVSTL